MAIEEVAVATTELKTRFTLDPSLLDESWTRTWQTNRLVVMVKEPAAIFAYWEVTNLRKKLISEHFQSDWTSLPFFLQVHDVTCIHFNGYNANSTRRIPVHPMSDNWYIHSVEPGRKYQADFGTTTWQGQFFTILRSNIVETPSKSLSHRNEPSIRFGTLHTTSNNIPAIHDHFQVADHFRGRQESWQSSDLNEPWQDQFNGYSLSGQKRGDK